MHLAPIGNCLTQSLKLVSVPDVSPAPQNRETVVIATRKNSFPRATRERARDPNFNGCSNVISIFQKTAFRAHRASRIIQRFYPPIAEDRARARAVFAVGNPEGPGANSKVGKRIKRNISLLRRASPGVASRRFLPLNREIFALQTPRQFIELFTR